MKQRRLHPVVLSNQPRFYPEHKSPRPPCVIPPPSVSGYGGVIIGSGINGLSVSGAELDLFLCLLGRALLLVLYLSFHESGILARRFVGLKNSYAIWQDKVAGFTRTVEHGHVHADGNSQRLCDCDESRLAVATNQRGRPASIRAALYFPTLTPIVLAALLWIFVVHPDFGVLNFLVRIFGAKAVNWLG